MCSTGGSFEMKLTKLVQLVVVVEVLPVGTPEGRALFTFFRTEGVAHELDAGKKGGGDVSGAGGTVALSLWCHCVVAYVC